MRINESASPPQPGRQAPPRRPILLPTLLLVGALSTSAGSVARAHSPHFNYLMHCGGCHNTQGEGAPPLVPSLKETLGPLLALEGGRDYLVRVPGAFQTPVSDDELAGLINFVLLTFNRDTLPEQFQPYTGAEVAAYRARGVLSDPLASRAALWGAPHYDAQGPTGD